MRFAGMLIGGLVAFVVLGCGSTAPEPLPDSAASQTREENRQSQRPDRPASEWTANQILEQLLATYRQARSYQDQAVVRLTFRQGGQPVNQELPAAVAFERPNKLSVQAYQATIKCDGREFRAKIDDPATNNVDGQVVVRPAPTTIKLTDLASDPLLYDIVSSRLRRQPIQLELLLESGGLVSAFNADVACKRLEDQRHQNQPCFRVEVPSPGGAFVFWVDQEQGLLRRLDYPAAALVPELANDPSVAELSLAVDLREPRLNATIEAETFTLEIPSTAKRMKSFVVPVRPLPSSLFGKQPKDFYFTRLTGEEVAAADMLGRTTILTWYHDNPACEATLHQISLANQRLKDGNAAAFFAVATDPTTTTPAALQKRLADWQVDLPIVRDLEAFGDKSFQIEVQPTIVVLDKSGKVQVFQPGGSPDLADQLVQIVERVGRGDDLAAEILNQHARDQGTYEQLVARGGAEPGEVLEMPEAVIRRRSEPARFKLRTLWTCNDLKSPGNLLVIGASDAQRILVIEGWRSVVEVSVDGKVIDRKAFDIPEVAAITFLRSARHTDGRQLFVGSAPLAPQFFVFDEQWKSLLAFPPSEQAPLQVMDLQVAPLERDSSGTDVLIASAGNVGAVAVSLEGETRWRNHKFPNALSIAATQPDDFGHRRLLIGGESGAILPVNRFGNDEATISIPNWQIARFLGGPIAGQSQAGFLALAGNPKGQPFAVGLDDNFKELWNYPLPPGVHQRPIEAVTSSQVFPGFGGEWWIAGPDGSIHLITADGKLFDSFSYGEVLSGIAATRLKGQPALIVAADSGLTAYAVELAAGRPSNQNSQSRER